MLLQENVIRFLVCNGYENAIFYFTVLLTTAPLRITMKHNILPILIKVDWFSVLHFT